LDKFWT